MNRPPLLTSIIDWLRAGYPDGVSARDYVPLIALLRRRLSDDEVRAVTAALLERDPTATASETAVDAIDIGVLITKVTDEMPLESDIARVREHLIAGGWSPNDGTEPGPESDPEPE